MAEKDYIAEVLDSIGNDIIEAAQRELGATRTVRGKKRRSVSSGTLKNSLIFNTTARYNKYVLDFTASGKAANYLRYVTEGRRKNSRLPPIKAVEQWMKEKPVRLRSKDGGFIKNTPEARKQAAWAVARGIAKNGIEPFPFYANAIESTIEKRGKDLEDAMIKQIEFRLKLK